MLRTVLHAVLAFTASTSLTACVADGQASDREITSAAPDRIVEAMSAAPHGVAQHATIMDRPATPGGEPALLKAGTNGWTCTPSSEAARRAGRANPSCADEHARAWYAAHAARQVPQIERVGLNYKLMGDNGASNVDPFASGPTADNEWVVTGPHVIIFVPNVAELAGLPSDPGTGGPYVMWRDTPYAHIMVPVAAAPSGPAETR